MCSLDIFLWYRNLLIIKDYSKLLFYNLELKNSLLKLQQNGENHEARGICI